MATIYKGTYNGTFLSNHSHHDSNLSSPSLTSPSLTSSLSSPLTVKATEMSKDSFDITQLANLLQQDQPLSINTTDSSLLSSPVSITPPLHTIPKKTSIRAGSLHHNQKILLPLSSLKEIPPPSQVIITSSKGSFPIHSMEEHKKVPKKNFQGILKVMKQENIYGREIPETTTVVNHYSKLPLDCDKHLNVMEVDCSLADNSSNNPVPNANAYLDQSHVANPIITTGDQSHDTSTDNMSHDLSHDLSQDRAISTDICSTSLSSIQQEIQPKPEVIWRRNNSNMRNEEKQKKAKPECQHDEESLKFDEVVYNGYKVLKEVKRHKNMAETNWDLAMLEFDESKFGLDQYLSRPSKKNKSLINSKEEIRTKRNTKIKMVVTSRQQNLDEPYKCVPRDQNISFPKPDVGHLYQYMTTGQLPTMGVPVYLSTQTAELPQSAKETTNNDEPVTTIHVPSRDVGVQISNDDVCCTKEELTSASRRESKLVREVLPSINIHDNDVSTDSSMLPYCVNDPVEMDKTNKETSPYIQQATIITANKTLSSPTNTSSSLSSIMETPLSPSCPPLPPPSCMSHLHCHPCGHHCYNEENKPPPFPSDTVNRQSHAVYTRAQEWIERELLARLLAAQTDNQLCDEVCEPVESSMSDNEVISLVRKELFEQAMLLLKEDQQINNDHQSDNTQYEEQHELQEYSFSFESYTPEDSAQQHVIITPILTPISSPTRSPVPIEEPPQCNIILTPQASPVLVPKEEQEINDTTTHEAISTPDLTTDVSIQQDKSDSLTTPTCTPIGDTPISVQVQPHILTLSLTDTTPTSSEAPSSTRPTLSLTNTSTDHDVSYGEHLLSSQTCILNNQNGGVSISEGEVPLSPGDKNWKRKFPLKLGLEKEHHNVPRKVFSSIESCHSETPITSIGEVKGTNTGHGDPFNQFLTKLALTSTPDSDTSITTNNNNEQDTLADIPSLSDDMSGTSYKNDSIRQLTTHTKHKMTKFSQKYETRVESLSPGEVPKMIIPSQGNDFDKSLSDGEMRNAPQMISNSDSETFSFGNRVRDGIDVIDISHKNNKTISDNSTSTNELTANTPMAKIKNKVIISSEKPKTLKQFLPSDKNTLIWEESQMAPDPVNKVHQGPVILMENSVNKESDYSFTFSSISTPLTNNIN